MDIVGPLGAEAIGFSFGSGVPIVSLSEARPTEANFLPEAEIRRVPTSRLGCNTEAFLRAAVGRNIMDILGDYPVDCSIVWLLGVAERVA
jgi:hypothetical protein